MAARDNRHSRLVYRLKIVLPLVALVVLSTLFLVPRDIQPLDPAQETGVDVEALARDRRMIAPEYAGVTTDGAALTVIAGSARPDAEGAVSTAEAVSAGYDLRGGVHIGLEAASGRIDDDAGRMWLGDGVEIVTSTGYRMVTDHLDGALDRTELLADSPVDAEAPFGRISSGGLEITVAAGESPGYVVVFNRGVKLIYEPAK